jgi:hypothetical protein
VDDYGGSLLACLAYGDRDLYVDLAAEEAALAAEKSGRKIAVEIKSFVGPSPMRELELALGQFVLYRSVLAVVDSERRLYMAVPDDIYASLFASQFGQLAIRAAGLRCSPLRSPRKGSGNGSIRAIPYGSAYACRGAVDTPAFLREH